MKIRASLLAAFFSLLTCSIAAAEPPRSCDSPYNATESLFGWLQPEFYNPKLAARCIEPRGRSSEQLQQMAKQIKAVYDAKALFVEVDKLSKEPDWKDPETEKAQFAPHSGLPEVIVVRQKDGKWRWTRESQDKIEASYADINMLLGDDFIDKLPGWMRHAVLTIQVWQYLALAFLVLIGLIVRRVIAIVFARRFQQLADRFGRAWASNLIALLSSPLATMVMGIVLWLSYPILRLPVQVTIVLNIAVRTLIIFSIVWAVYRLIDVVAEIFATRAAMTETKLDDQLVPLLSRSAKVITVISGALLVLQNLDVNVASLLAGLGIGGLAFAFAAQDTLANFFGSIMIFLDRPFQIGDWIVMDGAEGIVEEVGFRSTRVRTFYNSIICVPNSKFTASKIDNYGVRTYRRIFTTVGLTYDTTPEQMQAFVEGVRAIIKANPHTRKDYYEIHMSGFGAHSLDVMLYFFFKLPSWSDELRERHNVFLEVMRLAKELDVSFAFPTSTLHLEQVAQPGAKRTVPEPASPEKLADIVRAYGPDGTSSRPSGPQIAGGLYAEPPQTGNGSERNDAEDS